jgi:hypothetical protein
MDMPFDPDFPSHSLQGPISKQNKNNYYLIPTVLDHLPLCLIFTSLKEH